MQYLREKVTAAIESQHQEGYWAADWYNPVTNKEPKTKGVFLRDGPYERVLVTGHVLEWLELLPLELQASIHVHRRAGRWLCAMEGEISRLEDCCPYAHAVIAVSRLTDRRNGPVESRKDLSNDGT